MALTEDYQTIAQIDVALLRAAQRRKAYRGEGLTVSVEGQSHVIDRLLDRRLVLMKARDVS